MDNSLTHFNEVQCPFCLHPSASEWHSVQCLGGLVQEITEVVPPERARKRREEHGAVEPDAFPIVSAAHEFKTPLVVMLGYADMLSKGLLGELNEKQQQVINEIHESAVRLQKLIKDLLLLSELRSPENGAKVEPRVSPVDCNQQLKQIFDYWIPRARQRTIEYELRLSPGDPAIAVEPFKFQHILSNLIENALKYTPSRGRITVSASQCFWDRRKAQSEFLFNMERIKNRKVLNAIRVEISDTGPGIAREHHERIFGDFVQLRGASSTGTGLGLAIARRLVEKSGGLIWVESEPGKGSKFSLLLSQVK